MPSISGTTTTSLISALSQDQHRRVAIQVFLYHFFFNLIGVLVFFIFKLPKLLAISLAEKVAVYQWFGVFYIIGCFILVPVAGICLSLTSPTLYRVIMYTVISLFLIVWIITKLQETLL